MLIDRFTNRTAAELKNDERALVEVLQGAGAHVRGREVTCPFCGDRHPSGGIYAANGHGFRYKCHSCGFNGSVLDVIARVDGLSVGEVIRRLRGENRWQERAVTVYPNVAALTATMPGAFEAAYQYADPNSGLPDMIVLRSRTPDDKTFRIAKPAGGGFVMQAPDKPWPLYNRAGIQRSDTVVVVEGERCVDALGRYDVVATTSPGGAGKAELADWQPLAGKNVILWADNDEPGRAHMNDVESALQNLEPAPHIWAIEPSDLDLVAKEDAADLVAQLEVLHTDPEQIRAAMVDAVSRAKPRGIAAGVQELIEGTISGRRQAIRWPWPCVGGLTKALLPGTVTILCGNVGASKSFMLLQAAAYWYQYEIKTAIYELEEDREFHLTRCLAQQSGCADVTDPDWIRNNPKKVRALFAENEYWLENFGTCIFANPDTQPTLEQLAKWVQDRAKAGYRVIGVDPVTAAAHKSRATWGEDNAFLQAAKRAAVDYRCSVVLITHPIKTVSRPNVTQLAGGAAYQRFAQTILWLESHGDKTSKIKMACGTTAVKHNRTLHLLKARNGKGQGVKLAFNFQAESLTLKELGIIVRGEKARKKTSEKQETEGNEAGDVETQDCNGSEVRYTVETVQSELW
jgi:hypothetical protein